MNDNLLSIENLKCWIKTASNKYVRAIDGVNFTIKKGDTLVLLGESGCGKSMVARSIMQLQPEGGFFSQNSKIKLNGVDLLHLPEVAMRKVRGREITMIFQEPQTSLNPVLTIAKQIIEVVKLTDTSKLKYEQRCLELLKMVGIKEAKTILQRFPHELSGGQKQRIMIAMAIATKPKLLIADEPTTALDATVQIQILKLLKGLQKKLDITILFITHDIAVAKYMADSIAVMYAGIIVELASNKDFFTNPAHPYSLSLLQALPNIGQKKACLPAIAGKVPDLQANFELCRFLDRCSHKLPMCEHDYPEIQNISANHTSLCNHAQAVTSVYSENSQQQKIKANDIILNVKKLSVRFPIKKGIFRRVAGYKYAVQAIDFNIFLGQTLALVGESGCGKTTAAKAIANLITCHEKEIYFLGQDLSVFSTKERARLCKDIQIIFQDPFSSLNPKLTIFEILHEAYLTTGKSIKRNKRVIEITNLLVKVGLHPSSIYKYPHEFSGGQRQRIAIARSLAVEPKLIICDEPTSALDVSVQAQILNLLKTLQQEFAISYLFISHDIAVVSHMADYIAVMQDGKIVENNRAEQVLKSPQHPYTKKLLGSVLA